MIEQSIGKERKIRPFCMKKMKIMKMVRIFG